MPEFCCDVLIIGSGVGGCAAALAAARCGKSVIVTEETDWIGGQFTSQAVPPDENQWVEQFGVTRSYREFRQRVRDYYRRNYPLAPAAYHATHLNPGNGSVSRLCHEPRVALAVLQEMLAPHLHSGRIRLLLRCRPVGADVDHDQVRQVTVQDLVSGREYVLHGAVVLDATETGELLPLTGAEYVTGAESSAQTGEMHALAEPDPLAMQSITFCFAMDYLPGEEHLIEEPAQYRFWRDFVPELQPAWSGKLLSWTHPNVKTLQPRPRQLFAGNAQSMWRYRRIIDQSNFLPGTYASDITIVNWPQNDYMLGPVFGASTAEAGAPALEAPDAAHHLEAARQLSLALLYWMQTEAPRPDGGCGYPGLRLRPDVVGTDDGLAKSAYIRESRRIKAQFTVTEAHVGWEMRGGNRTGTAKAERFPDSVGIGHYNIDLHPDTRGHNYIDIPACPFQIPLGALLPVRLQNLLPAGKNLGVTHITNGCYRLHPVEWNVGEAAGYLAAYALDHHLPPAGVRQTAHLEEFQKLLISAGVELAWPNIGP